MRERKRGKKKTRLVLISSSGGQYTVSSMRWVGKWRFMPLKILTEMVPGDTIEMWVLGILTEIGLRNIEIGHTYRNRLRKYKNRPYLQK